MKLMSFHKYASWLEALAKKKEGLFRVIGPERFKGNRWARATLAEQKARLAAFMKSKKNMR